MDDEKLYTQADFDRFAEFLSSAASKPVEMAVVLALAAGVDVAAVVVGSGLHVSAENPATESIARQVCFRLGAALRQTAAEIRSAARGEFAGPDGAGTATPGA